MLIKGVDQRNTMYNGRHISSDIFDTFGTQNSKDTQ